MKKIAFTFFSCVFLNAQNIGVSIKPIEYLVNKIAPNVNTVVLVDDNSNPHNFELKAKKILELDKSKAFFAIGVEAEDVWLSKLKENTKIKVIRIDDGIKKISYAHLHEHEHDAHHEHEHEHEYEHDAHHEHEHEHDAHHEHHHHHSGADVHIWTSTENLKILSNNIAKNLKLLYPENAAQIDKNLQALLKDLEDLKTKINEQTKDLKTKAFISSHPAWGYFAKEFNLKEYSLEFEGKELKIKELKKMIDLAKENKACLLISSALFNTKSVNLVKEQSNLKLANINALTYNILDEMLNFAKTLHNNCSN